MRITTRLKHAWNAFSGKDASDKLLIDYGNGYLSTYKPDRTILQTSNERSIVASVINQIGIDAASISIRHVRTDENGKYIETINSQLNERLTMNANKDQTARQFMQDAVMSLCDEGCIAIVPIDTSISIVNNTSFDILSYRVAKILEWYPDYVKVDVYDDNAGVNKQIVLPKKNVAIVENPLYAVMNQPNSTMQRLIRKLNLLDKVDESNGSGKLDVIIQLPYQVKTEAKKKYVEERKKDIENQLAYSKYGIAYIDAAEHVTQLNRPAENTLQPQIEYLTRTLYSQLGSSEEVFNGTADEKTMLNYHTRTIEPIVAAITDAMTWKFLTKTARTQHQRVMYFRDPFKLTPATDIAELGDKFTRNEILSPNEIRAIIGYRPSDDPKSDELRNRNLNSNEMDPSMMPYEDPMMPYEEESMPYEESMGPYEEDTQWKPFDKVY